jgi:hypothetical protein
MHCSMCDAVLPPDAQFCIVCGAAVLTAQTGHTQRLPPTQDWPIDPTMERQSYSHHGATSD